MRWWASAWARAANSKVSICQRWARSDIRNSSWCSPEPAVRLKLAWSKGGTEDDGANLLCGCHVIGVCRLAMHQAGEKHLRLADPKRRRCKINGKPGFQR